MVIDNPAQDIVMRPGYDVSSIDGETLYVNAGDNFKWKYKKLLRMDGVKTISYLDTVIQTSPIVIDFEKLKLSFTNLGARSINTYQDILRYGWWVIRKYRDKCSQ